jgi:hypothetical protein
MRKLESTYYIINRSFIHPHLLRANFNTDRYRTSVGMLLARNNT